MIAFNFYLVGDPMPKERPRLGRGGRVFTPEKTLTYEHEIMGACLNQMFLDDIQVIDQPIAINMQFYRATNHRVDIDNLVKAVLDGLNGVAYTDDRLIFELCAAKYIGVGYAEAKVMVSIKTLPPLPVVNKKRNKKG